MRPRSLWVTNWIAENGDPGLQRKEKCDYYKEETKKSNRGKKTHPRLLREASCRAVGGS